VARGLPAQIYDASLVDQLVYVSQDDAEETCRRLAREEGIFAGISAAGACWVAQEIARGCENATIALSSATAATATCPPACFRPERAGGPGGSCAVALCGA
jgi:cysteine synthase